MSAARVQIAIVGGGVVGATLALLLVQRARIDPSQLLLVEPEPPQPRKPGAGYELRVSAIAPGNRRMLQELQVWAELDLQRVAAYEHMVVWQEATPADSPDVLRFDAAQLGEPDLGSIVENLNLQTALLQRCAAAGIGVKQAAVTALTCDDTGAHIEVGDDRIEAELVVGADGASSAVRRMAGILGAQRDYGQRGIVATVDAEAGHQHTAWQRFLQTGPLALLPLASGQVSIVWSAQNATAEALLAMPADQFNNALTEASAGVLGVLRVAGARAAFPLRRFTAERFASHRCVLVGDAAHVIHPLAGQGVNEGLQDAVALADVLAARPARESVGAAQALQRYARARRSGNVLTAAMVDGLDTLFTGSGPLTAGLARAGMAVVARSRAAQRFFFTRAAAYRPPRS
ncbi:MAG TPA: FAD-dependent monooxygenase [Steroidobacteraceae bacterium]|nr:FAD-dependent monooxygenase [Steroidobacteraceae bacterium]